MNTNLPTLTSDLREMSNLMHRWFGTTEGGLTGIFASDWAPKVDVEEDEEAYTIKAEVPDVKRKDIKIHIEDGVLTLSGERRQDKEEKTRRYHRVERSYGTFMRSFTVPGEVDPSKVKATFADGLLQVVLPKGREVKRHGREIPVG